MLRDIRARLGNSRRRRLPFALIKRKFGFRRAFRLRLSRLFRQKLAVWPTRPLAIARFLTLLARFRRLACWTFGTFGLLSLRRIDDLR
jgi:hypothetical protein